MMPPVETILQDIKEHLPGSVFLHVQDEQPQEPPFTAPPLTVLAPLEWIEDFKQIHSCEGFGCQDQEDYAQHFLDRISWATEEQHIIEEQTRGQRKNKNWHSMRKGLLTASNIWKIFRSTNQGKTAERLIENYGSEKEDARVPEAIKFGQDNEDRALTLFTRSHRYRHRQCSVRQPGLVVSTLEPYLAASPDAVVDCKHQNCGQFLAEVKCLYKHRNFHPKLAITERGFAERGADGQLSVKQEHAYYYQMQCQMAVTGIHKCHLCVFTKKGIESIEVPFDPIFWDNISKRLSLFWKTHVSKAFANCKQITLPAHFVHALHSIVHLLDPMQRFCRSNIPKHKSSYL
ncbi:uncharacterized protein [Littorina saxatilis]|uniref:uncharacterized protein n=1 Tax=Littorina saxatilis TaxID=31220 RepID=UPI0038B6A600